jgi:hypothetical protein
MSPNSPSGPISIGISSWLLGNGMEEGLILFPPGEEGTDISFPLQFKKGSLQFLLLFRFRRGLSGSSLSISISSSEPSSSSSSRVSWVFWECMDESWVDACLSLDTKPGWFHLYHISKLGMSGGRLTMLMKSELRLVSQEASSPPKVI